MTRYFLRRFATMAVTLLAISVLIFVVIKLPPGDFLTMRIQELMAEGDSAAATKADFLRSAYGLDLPVWQQYLSWIGLWPRAGDYSGLLQGNFGWSFEYDLPVIDVVGDALGATLIVNLAALVFIHLLAIPLAVFTAVRRRGIAAETITFLAYLGLATPSFLLALILLFYLNRWFGISIGGLVDPDLADAPFSLEKLASITVHLIVPIVVIALASTAAMIRRMKANLLDELHKPYAVTARAKGLGPTRALLKYPFRMVLNPFVADIGNMLPGLISGSVLVSLVLSLPTVGPILVQALRMQDQYLAGFILLFVAVLTVVGMLIADLVLALIDPRIRFGK